MTPIYHLERIDGATPISLGLTWSLTQVATELGSGSLSTFNMVYIKCTQIYLTHNIDGYCN